MKKQTVRYEIDLANPPALTEAQKAELRDLKGKQDKDIDYSDIPPLEEKFWQNAVRNPFYKPTKTSTTVRIDSDVLAWLRASGKGYQSRMNAILRREMLASTQSENKPDFKEYLLSGAKVDSFDVPRDRDTGRIIGF